MVCSAFKVSISYLKKKTSDSFLKSKKGDIEEN